jgi:hypothetical protein
MSVAACFRQNRPCENEPRRPKETACHRFTKTKRDALGSSQVADCGDSAVQGRIGVPCGDGKLQVAAAVSEVAIHVSAVARETEMAVCVNQPREDRVAGVVVSFFYRDRMDPGEDAGDDVPLDDNPPIAHPIQRLPDENIAVQCKATSG